MSRSFEDIKIPKDITETFYAVICLDPTHYNFGSIRFTCAPLHKWAEKGNNDYKGWKLLAEKEVTLALPAISFDPRGEAVDLLEKEKKRVMAEYQVAINRLDDQIQKFKAIEFYEEKGEK